MVRVWTHTSIAKWPELAFERSAEVGGNTLQIFAKSPRGWQIPHYSKEQLDAGMEMRKKYKQVGGLIHSNYLANLSKPSNEIRYEIDSIVHDFMLAHIHGYDGVNVHVGKSAWRTSKDEAMKNMVINIERILKDVKDKKYTGVQFLFENTAGQWSEIGSNIDELGYFWKNYLKDLPVKFCIDTAHCQWGWIDVSKREEVVEQFDSAIWIEQVYSIHLNDAKVPLWAKLDRHASLGYGFIGWPALAKVIKRATQNDRGIYIETPEPERWPDEVAKVKLIADWKIDWIEKEHAKVYKTQALKKFIQPDGPAWLF